MCNTSSPKPSSQVARYKAEEIAAEAELRAADVELGQSRITAPSTAW